MSTLTDDVKTFIVQANARFDPPSRVAEAVKAKFGVVVTRAQVERYDPDKTNGRHLTEGLRATFKSDARESGRHSDCSQGVAAPRAAAHLGTC